MDPPNASEPALKPVPEPRWPSVLALLVVGVLYWAMPPELIQGPRWILLLLVGLLLVPADMARRSKHFLANEILGYVLAGAVTIGMVIPLSILIYQLPTGKVPPRILLHSAAALWIANILVFASWYWRLDAGGPHARYTRGHHIKGDFLFPQMAMVPPDRSWSPGFVDYLFLAFNTSTAFSPTDVPVLSRWAKVLMMIQSLISFSTVALVAARAINIL